MTALEEFEEAMKVLKRSMQPETDLSIVMEAWCRTINAHVKLLREQLYEQARHDDD